MQKKIKQETPLMVQHKTIKAKFPDAILLFRVGDFYETFGSDAIITSKILGITLTKRNSGDINSQELAGFPHHALETYLHKLVKSGYRVAICDQLEDPKTAKGIVKRGVTEVVTPGIASDEKLLDKTINNFLCALIEKDNLFGIAFVDISTGYFFVEQGDEELIEKLLQTLNPSEILFSKNYFQTFKNKFSTKFFTYQLDDWIFTYDYAYDKLIQQFQINSLKGFGIEHLNLAIIAAGTIIHYLKETEHNNLKHLNNIQRLDKNDCLWMDQFTIKNLELLSNQNDNNNSLIKAIDNTSSAMGARLLRHWILFPLKNISLINERLNSVSFFIENDKLQNNIKKNISEIGDIERFISRIPLKKINPREIKHIGKGLQIIEEIKNNLIICENNLLKRLADSLNPCIFIKDKIFNTIVEQAPLNAQKGELIKNGISKELDDLKTFLKDSKNHLLKLQEQEILATNISSLKISFNNIFGYYLEVSNTHKNKVPTSWIRKQTLSNAERYITPELKIFEEKILGAEEKIINLETEIYDNLLNELQDYINNIQINAKAIAQIDCLNTFAFNAINNNYCKPIINESLNLEIIQGRHPVIEQNLKKGDYYIPNDIKINTEENQIIILTGPNMSGKSALLRQVALTILLCHIGSFTPCQKAIIPLTDKIFTRVGANDNISAGESTFMVEMNETASILNNFSERSLILLDEIGRGTSTYDGISIAWSIVEYLHNYNNLKPKTLFATHYHELNELENFLPRVKNYHISYTESNNKVIFLRKLILGGIKNSFGVQVAKMAGFPISIIQRAYEILKELEQKQTDIKNTNNIKPLNINIVDKNSEQLKTINEFFYKININSLTPIESLIKLNELKKIIEK